MSEEIPTPRTDAAALGAPYVETSHAAQLERELNDANEDRRRMFSEWNKAKDDALRLACENADLERALLRANADARSLATVIREWSVKYGFVGRAEQALALHKERIKDHQVNLPMMDKEKLTSHPNATLGYVDGMFEANENCGFIDPDTQ
jgi:hypothetical protein